MKTFRLLMLSLALFGTTVYANSDSTLILNNPIKFDKGKDKDQPRGIFEVPFTCTYSNGILNFQFNDYIGEIEVKIFTPTKYNVEHIDSNQGYAQIPLGDTIPGIYVIEVEILNGDNYIAYLSL
jgi:hypothetical protein